MSAYQYRAYCDICKVAGPWSESASDAKKWRHEHFTDEHPNNPMVKENCRIQRENND